MFQTEKDFNERLAKEVEKAERRLGPPVPLPVDTSLSTDDNEPLIRQVDDILGHTRMMAPPPPTITPKEKAV